MLAGARGSRGGPGRFRNDDVSISGRGGGFQPGRALISYAKSARQFVPAELRSYRADQWLLGMLAGAYFVQQSVGPAATIAGSRVNAYITRGRQWHRLVSPIFLHSSASHALSNGYSLWSVGPLAARTFGGAGTLLIYFASGIGGNIAGLALGKNPMRPSVGASGAVFGLLGAMGAVAYRRQNQAMLASLQRVLFLNLFVGLQRGSRIDNLGHVGGGATGALVALWLLGDQARSAAADARVTRARLARSPGTGRTLSRDGAPTAPPPLKATESVALALTLTLAVVARAVVSAAMLTQKIRQRARGLAVAL